MKTFQVTQAAAHTAYCGDKRGRGRGWGGGNVTLHLPLGGQGLCRVGGLCSPSLEPRMLRLAEGVPEPTGKRSHTVPKGQQGSGPSRAGEHLGDGERRAGGGQHRAHFPSLVSCPRGVRGPCHMNQ